ncbi:hypothetical protein BDFB_012956, partial [Asbolus verrucosus]
MERERYSLVEVLDVASSQHLLKISPTRPFFKNSGDIKISCRRLVQRTMYIHERVTRQRRELWNLYLAVERHIILTQDVMMWGAITYGSRSLLVFIQGTLNAKHYT